MRFAKEGYPFILISIVLAIAAYFLHYSVGIFFSLFALFTVYFFRDPDREIPEGEHLLTSAADGRVLEIKEIEKSHYLDFPHYKVSIFMSPFNVHVNRVPIPGTIEKTEYRSGKFFNASFDKASEHNERNAVWIKTKSDETVAFVQIAGFIARRIVSYAKERQEWNKGDRYGLIRFGSRMELYFSKKWQPKIEVGQHISAGSTVVAEYLG